MGNGRTRTASAPRRAVLGALRRAATLLVLGGAVLLSAGCLDDAEDQCFVFNSANDPSPSSVCTTGSSSTGTSSNVAIVSVSTIDELVVIFNTGVLDVVMDSWTLENDTSGLAADIFTFPVFTLANAGFVRVHSITGTDDADDLFWDGATNHWDATDSAVLKDSAGSPIDSCSNGESCWDGGT